MKAILFGSIGAIAETSDIQRRAYNAAMAEAGPGWSWDEETYAGLLRMSGGRERLRLLSRATGAGLAEAQVEAVHERKTEIACAEVARRPDVIRPGVAALVSEARAQGCRLGIVTSTYRPNIDAILAAAGDRFGAGDFDVIVTRDQVERPKPHPNAWAHALSELGLDPAEALAIEDSATGVLSARRAGLSVVALPGAFHEDDTFDEADLVLASLAEGDGLAPALRERVAFR